MARIIATLVVLAALVAGVGFYRGWFTVTTDKDSSHTDVTVTVDKDKIKEDEQKAKDKAKELEQRTKEKVESATQKNP
jgi:hypothetical protein